MTTLDSMMAASSLVSALSAIWAAWRVERWRRSDEWKGLGSRIEAAERKLGLHGQKFEEVPQSKDLVRLEGRMTHLESEVGHLPTKADIEKVAGAVTRVESQVKSAAQGVDRIESMLMKHALDGGAAR